MATTGGTLVHADGCLWIVSGDEKWLALWPTSYAPAVVNGNTVVVNEASGEILARVGTAIEVLGGETHDPKAARSIVSSDIPTNCIGGAFWQVGAIR